MGELWSPYVQGVFVTGIIFSIATMGLYVTYASGQISVMHMALVGVGGYAGGMASVALNLPFVVSLLFGAAIAGCMGAAVALLLRRMSDMVLMVATIAIGQGLSLVASNVSALGGSLGYLGIPLYTTVGTAFVVLAIVVIVLIFLRRTTYGVAVVAVGKEPTVAEALGISTLGVRMAAFAAGASLAGIAGVLQAHWLGLVDPTSLGFSNEAPLFIYMIIGGSSTLWGALLGGVGLTWLEEGLRVVGSNRFWILGLVLVIVVILRPQGLLVRRSLRSDGRVLLWKRGAPQAVAADAGGGDGT